MDKIKRIVNVVIPTTICNFKCHYCYLAQENAFTTDIPKLQYDLDIIQKALTVERLGGICLMNICAVGETLMAPYLYELVERMLDNGHYVAIVTNGSITQKIKKICEIEDKYKKKLFFKFSYHFLQLRNNSLTSTFFENVRYVRNKGISFTVELTANDESIEYIDEIKRECLENVGALPHIIESRDNLDGYKKLTKLSNEEHMKNWNSFETPAIKFQDKVWGQKRKEFCYAGDWEINLYLQSGNMTPCFAGGPIIQNIFEDVNEPIHFRAIGNKCPWSHCFASHVLLTYGIIPEIEAPSYDKIRNRKTTDGGEWLGRDIKYFFKHKLYENNKEYSTDKKRIINWYNDLLFNNSSKSKSQASKSLEKILNKKDIKKIGIISSDKYKNDLLELISGTKLKMIFSLKLDYSIYNNKIKSFIAHRIKYSYKKHIKREDIPEIKCYDRLPRFDAILVSNIDDYLLAKKYLKDICKKPIILITDLD